jgi:orotate phosphoribosyltransferase
MILNADILLPTHDTQSQIGLISCQPGQNMRGAVAVAHAAEVSGREVLLVNDVYTTGTAATECAQVLRRARVRKVWVAPVARRLNSASKYEDIHVGFKVSESQVFGEPDSVEKAEMDDFETLNAER